MTGKTISHYRVLEALGEGGTSVVYRAEDLALGRPVVLKFLSGDWQNDYGRIARFQHEARTVSTLNHPNICTIYEIGEHEGRQFLAMELLDGDVLSKIIGTRPLDLYRLVELAIQIADALDAAHIEGIVHRDVKPANIFVTRRDQVKLLDFGLAVLVPRRTATDSQHPSHAGRLTGGTAPYMSPEQVRGEELDARTDLFSLGVVLYEMATGRRPFIGSSTADVMDAIVKQTPVPLVELNPSIAPDLERIVDKALEKNRKLRYQTASDLRADLQRLKRDLDSSVVAVRARAAVNVRRPRRVARPTWLAVGAATSAIVAGAGLVTLASLRTRTAAGGGVRPGTSTGSDIALAMDVSAKRAAAVVQRPLTAAARPAEATPKRDDVPSQHGGPPAPVQRRATPAPARPGEDADEAHVEAPPGKTGARDDDASHLGSQEELRIARQKIELKLYDQAVETLRRVTSDADNRRDAIEAWFLIASIHETRERTDDAMGTYLEVASRYPDDPRAPEALYRMAQATQASKRRERDTEARRMLTEIVEKYPASTWAPRALLARGDIEERDDLHQRDDQLGGSVPSSLVTYRDVVQRYGWTGSATQARWKLARAYIALKRYDLAAAVYESLGVRDSEHPDEAWFAAGELYDKHLRDSSRARHAFLQVPASSPRYSEAQRRLRK